MRYVILALELLRITAITVAFALCFPLLLVWCLIEWRKTRGPRALVIEEKP